MPILEPSAIAPDFRLPDAQGDIHSLSDLRGDGIVWLTFFKISCPICQSSLHFIDRLARNVNSTALAVWTISQDPPDHTEMFNKEFEIHVPQLFDSEDNNFPVSDAYGIETVPTTFLIEQSGRIQQVSVGWDRSEFETMAATLASAIGLPPLTLFAPEEHIDEFRPGCASKN
jgi:peroxiredoxin